tara:strand:+ start:456 stop:1142 length:687 start_codon:yes stop_codon:yes gene_type:complete
MLFENKFLFVGKVLLIIFIVINAFNIFPLQLNDSLYYVKLFSTILDTSTLLLLGFSIPKYLFNKKIISLKNLKLTRKVEINEIPLEIDKLEKKDYFNSKISKLISISFVIIALIQPLNLIFILNKNDFYVTQSLNSLNKSFDIQKTKIMETIENSKINTPEDISNKGNGKNEEMLSNLEKNYKTKIDYLINNNNLNKFNQIKLIIRNIFMALVWSFAFLKLSRIHHNG